jgi:molybdenum cofactor cytidylyltransferase
LKRPVGAIVLAAGGSKRMGSGTNKLLEEVAGRPLLAWPVDALREIGADPIVCVTGHEAAAIRRALADREIEFVHNDNWAEGMGGSIARGAEAIGERGCEGIFVCLGDLPGLRGPLLEPLLRAFEAGGPASIYIPVHRGRRGHPVLFGADHLRLLATLHGDRGAQSALAEFAPAILEVEVSSDAIFDDVDTPEALLRARERGRG